MKNLIVARKGETTEREFLTVVGKKTSWNVDSFAATRFATVDEAVKAAPEGSDILNAWITFKPVDVTKVRAREAALAALTPEQRAILFPPKALPQKTV